MRVKIEQFCTLATSPSWQAWLYHFSTHMYKKFVHNLQNSKGCSENRDIMKGIVEAIDRVGGTDKFFQFLQEQYPHMLVNDSKHVDRSDDAHGIFDGYVHGILTYPHRIILKGSGEALKNKVESLLSKKGKSDYIIIDDIAYIEYLERSEEELVDQIPSDNWKLSVYRKDKA